MLLFSQAWERLPIFWIKLDKTGIALLHAAGGGVKSTGMGESTIVLPAAISALTLIVVVIQETRHRRRLRRVASIRRVLEMDPIALR